MKKKVLVVIAAVILVAGIGTGVFFATRANKAEPTNSAQPSAGETTTEEKIEYGEFHITKEEYDRNMPVQLTNPVQNFEKGKFYAPAQYDTGYGLADINWASDGRTVTVGNPEVFGGYVIYKLNEFGETTLVQVYSEGSSDEGNPEHRKKVLKPTYVYNDKHWVIKSSDDEKAEIYNHDSNGNITGICYSGGSTEDEKYTYDEYGNIVKLVMENYYAGMGDVGYWNEYDTDDRIVTVEYELNSIGLPTKKREFHNGDLSNRNTSEFSYVEVSEAQYNFYNQIIKTLKFSRAHSID